VVRVEVEGIGSLTNPIVDADGRVPAGSPAARLLAERGTLAESGDLAERTSVEAAKPD
jgi:hypothetical protein